MSEEKIPHKFEIKNLVRGLGTYFQARPNENQNIFDHIFKQVREGWAEIKNPDYIRSKEGYEVVTTVEAKGILIKKRIFHPRDFKGADFALSKRYRDGSFGVTVVQVKRNHAKNNFTFVETKNTKEITQLRNMYNYWGSSYYLLIDEIINPPNDMFIRTKDLCSIIRNITSTSLRNVTRVNVPNTTVRNYARGSYVFYDAFYKCRRGSRITFDAFSTDSLDYVNQTSRALVEILAQKRNFQKTL